MGWVLYIFVFSIFFIKNLEFIIELQIRNAELFLINIFFNVSNKRTVFYTLTPTFALKIKFVEIYSNILIIIWDLVNSKDTWVKRHQSRLISILKSISTDTISKTS